MSNFNIILGDVSEVLPGLEAGSFDACLCDPPYGLKFMGKAWDHGVPSSEVWAQVLDKLRPGGHLIAFGGTRTFHRLGVAIEDAGFEIRDCLSWLYGQGFPKSLDVSKAIDKAAGAEREVVGPSNRHGGGTNHIYGAGMGDGTKTMVTAPATPAAQHWHGYGTALKPAWEPAILAMKQLDGTFAQNALEHGVAGVNVEGGRIGESLSYSSGGFPERTNCPPCVGRTEADGRAWARSGDGVPMREVSGRWPANVLLDDEAAALLDEQVSRFFYTAKASPKERNAGGENKHPTIKPVRLTEYLAKLLLPPPREDGQPRRILVPFSGAGSEIAGCLRAGWDEVVGIEREAEYAELSLKRVPALVELEFK